MLDQIPLQLDRQGIKERENDETGGGGLGGRLFEGDDYFKYFYQRRGSDYSREVINRGTAVIRGNTVSLIMMITMMMMMIMFVMIKIVTEARGKSLIIKAY